MKRLPCAHGTLSTWWNSEMLHFVACCRTRDPPTDKNHIKGEFQLSSIWSSNNWKKSGLYFSSHNVSVCVCVYVFSVLIMSTQGGGGGPLCDDHVTCSPLNLTAYTHTHSWVLINTNTRIVGKRENSKKLGIVEEKEREREKKREKKSLCTSFTPLL